MVEVKRKKGESFEGVLRRFSRRLQQSGKQLEVRKYRFHAPKLSKTKQKASALRKIEIRVKRDYLARIGQLKEEEKKQSRSR